MNATCTKCGETKPIAEFYKRSDRPRGIKAACKTCTRAWHKAHYEENKDEKGAYRRAYRKTQAGRLTEHAYRRAYRKTQAGRLTEYKSSAKQRGIPFLLTEEEFGGFWQLPCHYCGAEIETIGLDRVDNYGPYHIDNVVSSCWPCNISKSNTTLDEWLEKENDVEVA
jgi:hypothetical protein